MAVILYVTWLINYNGYIREETDWDYFLNYNIADWTIIFFDWFNVEAIMEIDSDHVIVSFPDSAHSGVWVGDSCNGFKLFSVFSIFILAYPGSTMWSWFSKVLYIPLGVFIIHIANIMRVMALVLINDYNPAYLDFNHIYTFTVFVYAVIFGLWYFWLKKLSNVRQK